MSFLHRLWLLCLVGAGLLLGTGGYAQYYFFDSGSTTYPYQQGCAEDLYVRVNTESYSAGVTAGLLQLLMDPLAYSYNTSDTATVLQSNLFLGSTQTFNSWTSPTGTPSWIAGSNHTLLQIDRNNGATAYAGSNGLYGTLKFTPLYNVSNGSVSMIYIPGDTTKTTLSAGGVNRIVPSSQNPRLTGSYTFLQQPCVADSTSPLITISTPTTGIKRSSQSGIIFTLTDSVGVNGVTNVPYVFTGGAVWTGNPAGAISNQYGIDLSTLSLTVNGNGNTQTFLGSSFSTSNASLPLYAAPVGTTWQYLPLGYSAVITGSALFDYGIERTITVTGFVRDRANNLYTLSPLTFNQPVGPTMISSSRIPDAGAIFVNLSAALKIGIQDDWAGVNSGTILVTVQGINGTSYGPYIFSGSDLGLSEVAGQANLPNQYVNITNHLNFPTSGTIQVSVSAYDMAGNIDTISDYSFTTRPACSEFQCCNPVELKLGSGSASTYTNAVLNVFGGINAYFSGATTEDGTGYLYCGTENAGLSMYSGTSQSSIFSSFFEGSQLVISGSNIVAYVTGTNNDTILLVKLGNFTIKVYPGSRPGGDYTNLGELRLYDVARNFVLSGSILSNTTGTGSWLDNIPSGTYYIIYKGQSHLSSYLSGIVISQGNVMTLDFTTGSNLFNVQNKSQALDDGFKYQIAGDMKNIAGAYDFVINGNDISSIVYGSGLVEGGVAVLDPKNLNGDTSVNGADIAIVGINFQLTDPFLSGAVTFNW